MLFRLPIAAALFFGSVAGLAAQDTDQAIWQDLAIHDSPDIVAQKLTGLPEIKKARAKGRNVAVSYHSDGIELLGKTYRLAFEFDADGLKRVALKTDLECANKAATDYADMVAALSLKYPMPVDGQAIHSPSQIELAWRDATPENPTSVNVALTNGETVVLLRQSYEADKQPPTVQASGALARALGNFLWSQYQQRSEECDGTGNRRMVIYLFYSTLAEYRASILQIEQEKAGRLNAASNKL